MKLKVLTPSEKVFEDEVKEVIAEGPEGSFAILPRHTDFLSKISAGIVIALTNQDQERFIAVNEGVLVKKSAVVFLSVRQAVMGADLGELRRMVEVRFQQQEQEEKKAISVISKLESDFIQRFLELRKTR